MNLGPDNFLRIINFLVTGDKGIAKDVDIPPGAISVSGADHVVEVGGTVAAAVEFDTNDDEAVASFLVPRDYDRETDGLLFRFLFSHKSGTSIDVQPSHVTVARPGSDPEALSGYTAPNALTIDSDFGTADIRVDLSGHKVKPGDRINIRWVASEVEDLGKAALLGVRVSYRSTLVAYDEDSRCNL